MFEKKYKSLWTAGHDFVTRKDNNFDKIKLNAIGHGYPHVGCFWDFIGLYSYSGQTKASQILFSSIGGGIEPAGRYAQNTL